MARWPHDLRSTEMPNSGEDRTMTAQAWIEKVTFSGGETVRFSAGSIVVVVGPNNPGKSALLRELYQRFRDGSVRGPVATSIDVAKEGTLEEFTSFVNETHEQREGRPDDYWGIEQLIPKQSIRTMWENAPISGGNLGPSFCFLADAAGRLAASDPRPRSTLRPMPSRTRFICSSKTTPPKNDCDRAFGAPSAKTSW